MKRRISGFVKIVRHMLWGMVFCCFVLSGCGARYEYCDELPQISSPNAHNTYALDTIGIYVDVTPSMQGFLGLQNDSYQELVSETRYKNCLNMINDIMAVWYDTESISYYRVDTPLWKVKENVLVEARKFDYYRQSDKMKRDYELINLTDDTIDGYDSLCLTNALLNCKNDDLSIIVTDLYENERADAKMVEALKQNMTLQGQEGKTVGIIGMKSEYAGTVYDINDKEEGENYGIVEGDVTAEDICYRQFYIISIGHPQGVKDFCQRFLENAESDDEDIKCTIFWEYEICGLDYSDFNECLSRSKNKQNRLWPSGKILVNEKDQLDVFEYKNMMGKEKEILVCYDAERALLDPLLETRKSRLVPLPNGKSIEGIEVPIHIEDQAVWLWHENEFKKEEGLTELFCIEKVYYAPEKKEIYVQFKVSDKKLTRMALKLSCEVHFDYFEQLETEWAEQWSMPKGNIDLQKTRVLGSCINALKNKMPTKNSLLLDFAFYIIYDNE